MWNYEKVRRSLKKDHDRIYADLDQMKSKLRRESHHLKYQGFIGKQNGALCVLIMLLDSDALTDPTILRHRLDKMEQNFEEYCESFTKDDGVSMCDFRAGYLEKLTEIREVANSNARFLS